MVEGEFLPKAMSPLIIPTLQVQEILLEHVEGVVGTSHVTSIVVSTIGSLIAPSAIVTGEETLKVSQEVVDPKHSTYRGFGMGET